jgi:hypothetical protein
MTWWRYRQARNGEDLLDREDEGVRKWEKPLENSGALKKGEV